MISTLLTLLIIGAVALVVLSVVGAAVGLVALLLFKVVPLLLIGYVVYKLFGPKPRQISDADRKWLER